MQRYWYVSCSFESKYGKTGDIDYYINEENLNLRQRISLEAYRNRLKEQCEYSSLIFKFIMELENPPKSELAESPDKKQQTQPKMPSLNEYLNWALEPESGMRTHDEIYNYFARHFGHA